MSEKSGLVRDMLIPGIYGLQHKFDGQIKPGLMLYKTIPLKEITADCVLLSGQTWYVDKISRGACQTMVEANDLRII